jgi:NADPH-dependent 2,4-dienoyl-CoA reductase/sulfur reductase-like enzyme
MKVIIVGGVAGGASCAARLRRLDETAEILMVERGPYVSYANCGLPYHVGGVIPRESSLLVATEATFREQFAIDVRTRCEAIAISPAQKTVDLCNRRGRAVLCPPVRQRQVSGQLRRDGGCRCPARRHAAEPLEFQ